VDQVLLFLCFPTLFCSLPYDIYGVDAMRCGVLFWVLPHCATVLAKEILEFLCLLALFGREKEDRLFIIWVTELLVYHKLFISEDSTWSGWVLLRVCCVCPLIESFLPFSSKTYFFSVFCFSFTGKHLLGFRRLLFGKKSLCLNVR
jgi:hypothetical protein